MKAQSIHTIKHRELKAKRTNEKLSLSAILDENLKDLFVHHEIIPSNRSTALKHYHTLREEMIFILSGCVMVSDDTHEIDLHEGEFISFKPGKPHMVENRLPGNAEILVICSNPSNDHTIYQD